MSAQNLPDILRQKACWVAALACGLALLFCTRVIRAEAPSPTIILAFDESSAPQKRALAAIQAHVSDLPLEVVVTAVEREASLDKRLAASQALAASRHALGTFYLEVAEDRSLLIFFTEAQGEATLIRRLRANQQGLGVVLEQAAIVVRSLVEALLDGGSVGIRSDANRRLQPEAAADRRPKPETKSEAADNAPPLEEADTTADDSGPPEQPVSPSDLSSAGANAAHRRLALVAGVPLTQFATGAPWQVGLSTGVQWLASPTLYGGVRYTIFQAQTLSTADVALSARRHPLEVLVGYREVGHFGLNGELGLIADRVIRTTLQTSTPFQATSSDDRWMFALGARTGISWSPWSPLCVTMRVGADFVLTPYAYTIDSGQAVPSPRRVRPRVELELAVAVW
jgi:hypothetical protein